MEGKLLNTYNERDSNDKKRKEREKCLSFSISKKWQWEKGVGLEFEGVDWPDNTVNTKTKARREMGVELFRYVRRWGFLLHITASECQRYTPLLSQEVLSVEKPQTQQSVAKLLLVPLNRSFFNTPWGFVTRRYTHIEHAPLKLSSEYVPFLVKVVK